jgi:hypothetical protein
VGVVGVVSVMHVVGVVGVVSVVGVVGVVSVVRSQKARKSKDPCDASAPPAVRWFNKPPLKPTMVYCVSIAADTDNAIRSRVLLPSWASYLSGRIEVNVIDHHTTLCYNELLCEPTTEPY